MRVLRLKKTELLYGLFAVVLGLALPVILFEFFSSSQAKLLIIGLSAMVLAFAAIENERSAKKHPELLENELIGKRCTVVERFHRNDDQYQGRVRVAGEVWQALSDAPLDQGGSGLVQSRCGLVLVVRGETHNKLLNTDAREAGAG